MPQSKAFIKVVLTVGVILGLLGSFFAQAETFIVKDGQANAEIVIAEKPTRMQAFAAQELQEYIRKITGAELAGGYERLIKTFSVESFPSVVVMGRGRGVGAPAA